MSPAFAVYGIPNGRPPVRDDVAVPSIDLKPGFCLTVLRFVRSRVWNTTRSRSPCLRRRRAKTQAKPSQKPDNTFITVSLRSRFDDNVQVASVTIIRATMACVSLCQYVEAIFANLHWSEG